MPDDRDERIADLEELFADEPTDALTGFLLGTEYARAERDADAVRAFTQVVALDPAYSAARSGLAAALERQGEVAAALAAWQAAADCAAEHGDHLVARAAAAALTRLA